MSKNKIAKLLLALGIGVVTAASSVAVTGCNNEKGPDDDKGQQQVQPATEYTVKFDLNGGNGTAPADQTVQSGEKVAPVENPTHPEGREFGGWWTAAEGGEKWDFENDTVTGDITLYAHWLEIPEVKYTVTFDANGGEFAEGVKAQVETDWYKATAPQSPTKDGVTFLGWSRIKDGKELINFRVETFDNDTTVYAVWYEMPAEPEYEDVTTDVPLAELFARFGNGSKITENVTVGAVTFESGVYFDTTGGITGNTVNNQKKHIWFDLQGTVNSIKFDAKGGSSFTPILYKADDNSVVKDFGTITSAQLNLTAENLEAGKYYLLSTDGSGRLGNISYTQNLLKGVPVTAEVSVANTDILLGREYAANDVNLSVAYASGAVKNVTDFTVDTGKVDTSKVGTYPVRVKYTEGGYTVVDEYSVTVHAVTSIELGTYVMNNGTQTTFKTVYTTGATFSTAGLTVVGKTDAGISFVLKSGEYTAANPSLANAGTSKFTVSVGANVTGGATLNKELDIFVVAKGSVSSNTISVTVDPSKAVSSTNFKTISQAIDYVSNFDSGVIKNINIADGIYNEKVYIGVNNVHLIGSSAKTPNHTTDNGVVIVYDAIAGMKDVAGNSYGTNGSYTVGVKADGFVAENITFKNYYNTNALYDQSVKISSDSQAVALYVESNKAVFKGCKITSYHDTLYANKGYQYYEHCWIEGHTDYIFGQDARAYFYDCDIYSIGATPKKDGLDDNGGYVTALKPSSAAADWYFVYNNCRFDADENTADGSVALGRAWGADMKMVVINCTISGKFSTAAHTAGTTKSERYLTMSGNEPKAANMLEGNNTGAGALSASVANTCTVNAAYATEYGTANIATILNFNPADLI